MLLEGQAPGWILHTGYHTLEERCRLHLRRELGRMFVRNNGLVPEAAIKGDASGWELIVDGEVETRAWRWDPLLAAWEEIVPAPGAEAVTGAGDSKVR